MSCYYVVESFRNCGMTHYGIDPLHYFTTAGFAFDCFLKVTGAKLELISVIDIHMFLEKGIRGGISTVGSLRYAEANNRYCESYDPTKPDVHLMYYSLHASVIS